jgi:hypothetical protein
MAETGRKDDIATLLALGVLAYALETMIHEALGHGGVCVAQGHVLQVVTPLWMHCDVVTAPMVAAGPVANMIAALVSWIVLRSGLAAVLNLRLFVWLSLVFNGLVAAGYMVVGGAMGFGDWAYLFGGISPAWLWRGGLILVGALAYWLLLFATTRAYARFAGADRGAFVRRALVPSIGAAVIAVAAQAYGQGGLWGGLVLPLACTLLVGLSLLGMRDVLPRSAPASAYGVAFSLPAIVLALAVAAAYVLVIGPGLPPSRLA